MGIIQFHHDALLDRRMFSSAIVCGLGEGARPPRGGNKDPSLGPIEFEVKYS